MNRAMPQGSWLDPLCFIVYIHDMPIANNVHTHKYIDDTTLSEPLKSGRDSNMASHLHKIETWSNKNFMRINAEKTKQMTIHLRKKPMD